MSIESIRLKMQCKWVGTKSINGFNPLFSECVMPLCWTLCISRVKREEEKIRATLPDNKNRNHAKGIILYIFFDYYVRTVCDGLYKRLWMSTAEMHKIPLKNHLLWMLIYEWMSGCVSLCEWASTERLFICCCCYRITNIYTSYRLCTHSELNSPVSMSHPFDTHSMFRSWNIQLSLCAYTIYVQPCYRSMKPTFLWQQRFSAFQPCIWLYFD